MNYHIIGTDGKTYGPVGAEKIREWIAQRRVDSRTASFTEGASDWTFLGLLPEFAPFFASPPPLKTDAVPARKTNGFATAGLVCGLLAWCCLCCCCCCVPFSLLGLVFSIIALVQIQARPEAQAGRPLAILGLILSAAHLFFSCGLGLLQLAPGNCNWHIGTI
jgi:hypothetical protein